MLFLRQSRLLRRQLRRRASPRPANRRIILHIGAHKTGTTYIQQTLETNRARLPLGFETVPRRSRHLHDMAEAIASAQSEEVAHALLPTLRSQAKKLGEQFNRVETLLITHEGLPGPLPGRKQFKGLYPFAHLFLPAIVAGLSECRAEVSVVFYKRRFRDWQASLYRYRFRENPERAYSPVRFAERTGLPEDWQGLIGRLEEALPDTHLKIFSFEKDRATGFLGTALFSECGLNAAEIAALRRVKAKNVSRDDTRHDTHFVR